MLKFIESDSSGLPRKRKQVSQACEPCRRRKKRCHHVEGGGQHTDEDSGDHATTATTTTTTTKPAATATAYSTAAARPPSAPSAPSSNPAPAPWSSPASVWRAPPSPPPYQGLPAAAPAPHQSPTTSAPTFRSVIANFNPSPHDDRLSWSDASRAARPRPTLPPPQTTTTTTPSSTRLNRFVGDTNPEGLFIEASSPRSTRDGSRGGVGVWNRDPAGHANSTLAANPTLAKSRFEGPRRAFQDTVDKYVREHCLTCRPPPTDYAVLRQIYLTKLDPIFPALSEPLFRPQPAQPDNNQQQQNPADIIVQQVVSLAAASDPAAAKHLRLMGHSSGGGDGSGSSGSSSSHHVTPELLDCGTFCASLSSAVQAALDAGILTDRVLHMRVLLVFSLYMHPPGPEDADLPALLHSQAVHQMITLGFHLELGDKDPTRRRETCTVFCCLWALDRMTAAFYGRATLMHERDFGWDMGEAIARQGPAFRLLLMIIRLMDEVFALYRPIVKVREPLIVEMPIFEQLIIDADANKVTDATLATLEVFYHAVAILSCRYPDGSKESAMPAPATNSRRSLSADRITSIVGDEFEGCLSYLPFIPYAVSLSLSVAYRKMRFSSVPMFRARGRRAFRENTVMLRTLGDAFWTAKALAGMAEKTLRELDKATASLIEGEMGQNGGGGGGGGHLPAAAVAVAGRENGVAPSPGGPGLGGGGGGGAMAGGIPGMSSSATPAASAATPLDRPASVLGGGGGGVGGFGVMDAAGGRLGPVAQDYASENMMDARDIDVFGHLDPTFDIGAVDAVLDGNLDFGTSSNWFDMQQMWGYWLASAVAISN
ncbi:uncharacterized protein B0I36DRAFT_126444 [Microdochium trichocladiopsis]|uniref:Transcription factor domain-containing protein n=1 Tax=Microdochium trichocladiopsis TaxID=1682393 RepID=A0A9P8Y4D1_9PEZI|nr:uncharacterized protein B0I36DRAFT_126444 [Microdochium trichocladiopsis]KAH7028830.1 hypothetical protein B0I36DRAFT_126444 [Microdochium trichocladiopsis]